MKSAPPLALALALSACSAGGAPPGAPGALPQTLHRTSSSPIQHVVFIIQENRSFNNLFLGYPGATTQNYGYDTSGDKIALQPISLATGWDIDHSSTSFFEDCDGTGSLPGTNCKMDGWNNELAGLGAPKNFAYAYVPRSQIKPYWDLARQYVLADRLFTSNLDGSFISHQYAVAAYASRTVDDPEAEWGCEGGRADTIPTFTAQRTLGKRIPACFDNPSIASEADAAGVSWRFYSGSISGDGGIWSAYQAIKPIYHGADWNSDVINPPSQFLTDVAAGTLAGITWITPTYETSDHAGLNASEGPAWVASVVNAIGTSQYWNSTAIFIIWDDWGGWFDPLGPTPVDYDGYGMRVPLLVVSAYAKQRYVTHVAYETASVDRFIEDTFGLSPLAAADARAADPAADTLDYGRKPRRFKKIGGSKPAAYWTRLDRASAKQGKPSAIIGDD